MNTNMLARDVTTSHGTYSAGTIVTVLDTPRAGRRRVCLDWNGIHLGRKCHRVTIPADWLEPLNRVPESISRDDLEDLRDEIYSMARRAA